MGKTEANYSKIAPIITPGWTLQFALSIYAQDLW